MNSLHRTADRRYLGCWVVFSALIASIASTAMGQEYPNSIPAPYPATSTPEALPFESGQPFLAPTPPEVVLDSAAASEIDVVVEVPEEPKWYYPSRWIQLPDWDTAFELGMNGSSGTSDSFSMRTGGYIKRESKVRKIDFDIYYNRTNAGGVDTQNNAQANFRHDWLMPDSPWTYYAQSQLYYDEFQAFDLNLSMNGGLGFRFLDEDWVELIGRVGAGSSREFGGVDDEWVPEAQFGFDFEQQLSETQKLTASLDYYPQFDDFNRYRMLSELAWEAELAVPSNVSLKIAANNRYDSDSDGVDPNNLNYSVLLLWKL